jgi:MFS family permease
MTETSLPSDKMDASAKHVFWASYFGWLLDGYDTTIYAFVLVASLSFLLPNSGISKSFIASYGLKFFAIFLIGWGTAFVFGPVADKVGRMRTLGIAILLYALGTFFSGLSYNVTEFAVARFVAGFGLGAEWFIGGTGVSEVFPEKSRHIWAGRFHSAWYAGFILAAVTTPLLLEYIFTTSNGWRAIFFIGIIPAVILGYIRIRAKEPEVWKRKKDLHSEQMNMSTSFKLLFSKNYRKTTILLVLVMVPVITGLYGGTLFAPTAITNLVHATFTASTSATW